MELPSFVIPAATGGSPDSVNKRRRMAELMMASGMQQEPIRHWSQGANKIAQALIGGIGVNRADKMEAEGRKGANAALVKALQGGDQAALMEAINSPWMSDQGQAMLMSQWEKANTPYQPDWKTFNQGNDVYRYDQNDPNAKPAMFFDGPNDPPQPNPTRDFKQGNKVVTQEYINGKWETISEGDAFKTTPDTTVNVNSGSDKFAEEFAKGDAKAVTDIYNAGLSAQRNIGRIGQLKTLLESSPTGSGAALQQFAGEWGINTQGLDTIQAAQAVINSLVPEQRQPGSGPMSDADLALFKQSLPRIINQPGGNAIVVDTMMAIAQYDAEGAAIVQNLRAGKIDRATAFDMLQNRANPLANIGAGNGRVDTEPLAGNATDEQLRQMEEGTASPEGKTDMGGYTIKRIR